MTVDNLNTQRFTPYKDYTLNRLTSGVLQLSANTHLLIDETVMQPGKLDATGQSQTSTQVLQLLIGMYSFMSAQICDINECVFLLRFLCCNRCSQSDSGWEYDFVAEG